MVTDDGTYMVVGIPGAAYGNVRGAGKVVTRAEYTVGTSRGLTAGSQPHLSYGTVHSTLINP